MRRVLLAAAFFSAACGIMQSQRIRDRAQHVYRGPRGCLPCHETIRPTVPPETNHNFPCEACHAGNPKARSKERGHKGLIAQPQDPVYFASTCEKCHWRGEHSPAAGAEAVESIRIGHPSESDSGRDDDGQTR